MGVNASAYLLGRTDCTYPCDGDPIEDRLFATQRLDGQLISGRHFQHCTFANVSFKEVELNNCEFTDCAFINCYFRKSRIRNCRFDGSKFLSCQFPRISVQACNFQYALFDSCVIPFSEMEDNLPSQHNLRQELTAVLAHASEMLGLTKEASNYRLQSIKAQEMHLWAAVRSKSTWYQEHYPGTRKIGAFFDFLFSKTKGIIWGYGERWTILLINFLIVTLGIFPFLLWISRSGLSKGEQGSINYVDILWLSVKTILPFDGVTTIEAISNWTRVILTIEVLFGLLVGGLAITILFRAIIRR